MYSLKLASTLRARWGALAVLCCGISAQSKVPPDCVNTALPRQACSANDDLIRETLDRIVASQREDGGFDVLAADPTSKLQLEIVTVSAVLQALSIDKNSLRAGRYQPAVKRCVTFLRSVTDTSTGRVGPPQSPLPYAHVEAVHALAECALVSGYKTLRRGVAQGIEWSREHIDATMRKDPELLGTMVRTESTAALLGIDVDARDAATSVRSLVKRAVSARSDDAVPPSDRSTSAAVALYLIEMCRLEIPRQLRPDLVAALVSRPPHRKESNDANGAHWFVFGAFFVFSRAPNIALTGLDTRIRVELGKQGAQAQVGIRESAVLVSCLELLSRRVRLQ